MIPQPNQRMCPKFPCKKSMTKKISFMAVAASLAALFFAACNKTDAPNSEPRVFEIRGIVRGVDQNEKTMTVEHEDVPGLMPAMTMPFYVKEPKPLDAMAVGDAIEMRFVITDKDSWVESARKISRESVKLPTPKPEQSETPASNVQRIREGDKMPEFHLTDQKNREVTLETFKGEPFAFTFLFTRCPIPNFCPLMRDNFRKVREEIEADPALKDRAKLLAISFDTEFDTPEVLAKYGADVIGDADVLRFATGSKENVEALTRAFAVYVKPESGTITHGLATVLVDGDGVVRKIWRGNAWEPAELTREFKALIERK